MILYLYSEKIEKLIYIYINNYNDILKLSINLEYIDRIKILVSFIIKILDNIKDEDLLEIAPYDYLTLINIDEEKTYQKYPYVKKAFDIFYNIIDNLTEESPFYQGILQFNSKIYKELKTGEYFYSGIILNLTDIKLDLIKNINRFVIVSDKRPNDIEDFVIFEDKGLSVIINLYSFLGNKLDMKNQKKCDNATCIILFILFYQCFSQQKKNINNEKEELEKLLFGEIIDLKYLMKKGTLEKFLDPNLYMGKDFNNLRNIYSIIGKKEEFKSIENNEQKNEKINDNKKDKKKNNLLLHDLFRIYSNVSDEEKELLKDNEDYKRFLMLYEKKKKSTSLYIAKIYAKL